MKENDSGQDVETVAICVPKNKSDKKNLDPVDLDPKQSLIATIDGSLAICKAEGDPPIMYEGDEPLSVKLNRLRTAVENNQWEIIEQFTPGNDNSFPYRQAVGFYLQHQKLAGEVSQTRREFSRMRLP